MGRREPALGPGRLRRDDGPAATTLGRVDSRHSALQQVSTLPVPVRGKTQVWFLSRTAKQLNCRIFLGTDLGWGGVAVCVWGGGGGLFLIGFYHCTGIFSIEILFFN